MLITFTMNLLR